MADKTEDKTTETVETVETVEAVAVVLPPELASRFVTEATDPTPDQTAVARANASAIITAVEQVTQLPDGRYRSLALTALEEAQMWANKAVFS